MTIKQLIPKLIARYEKCINEMPEVGWRWYLIGNEAYSGVCSLSYNKFRKKLVNQQDIPNPTPKQKNSFK